MKTFMDDDYRGAHVTFRKAPSEFVDEIPTIGGMTCQRSGLVLPVLPIVFLETPRGFYSITAMHVWNVVPRVVLL